MTDRRTYPRRSSAITMPSDSGTLSRSLSVPASWQGLATHRSVCSSMHNVPMEMPHSSSRDWHEPLSNQRMPVTDQRQTSHVDWPSDACEFVDRAVSPKQPLHPRALPVKRPCSSRAVRGSREISQERDAMGSCPATVSKSACCAVSPPLSVSVFQSPRPEWPESSPTNVSKSCVPMDNTPPKVVMSHSPSRDWHEPFASQSVPMVDRRECQKRLAAMAVGSASGKLARSLSVPAAWRGLATHRSASSNMPSFSYYVSMPAASEETKISVADASVAGQSRIMGKASVPPNVVARAPLKPVAVEVELVQIHKRDSRRPTSRDPLT